MVKARTQRVRAFTFCVPGMARSRVTALSTGERKCPEEKEKSGAPKSLDRFVLAHDDEQV
jgi:hypothetical protein